MKRLDSVAWKQNRVEIKSDEKLARNIEKIEVRNYEYKEEILNKL